MAVVNGAETKEVKVSEDIGFEKEAEMARKG